eukprot:CAMPEP_0114557750 /NCGR_PEP_ID=MMETSP0114-20121206/10001_1 /TAXON_ID=31324 /ORGANISM="Goniomonas sp, Strain m" /LENGTH=486 /DNA_ID=CAMNT_0001743067 /DNA_START=59 /DNA_END=1519 /DNA_ORIENTATION=-
MTEPKNPVAYMSETKLQNRLSEIVLHCIDHNIQDPVGNFEVVANHLSQNQDKIPVEDDPERIERCRKNLKLFKVKVPPAEDAEDAEEEPPAEEEVPEEEEFTNEPTSTPDTASDLAQLEWTGMGFGRQEVFRLHIALQHLSKKEPVDIVRFWGKIFGTINNYYIAEVVYKDGERPAPPEKEEEEPPAEDDLKWKDPGPVPKEDAGEGEAAWLNNTNQYAYFVCTQLGEPWEKLPDVTPAQIVAARKLKRFFTGDLNSKVNSVSPPFEGLEREYLRAQICRIRHATSVGPKGLLTDATEEEDESPNVAANEEFKPLPLDELKNVGLGGWVHTAQEILPQGRCSWLTWPPKAEEEEEEEEEEEGKEKPAPYIEKNAPPLRGVELDEAVGRYEGPAWTARVGSNLMPQYSCAVCRSNRWPGAATTVFGSKIISVYVGYGLKASGSCHVAPDMPMMMEVEIEAQPEEEDIHLQPPPPPEEEEGEGEEDED